MRDLRTEERRNSLSLYFSLNLEPLLLSVENTSKAGVVIIRSSGG